MRRLIPRAHHDGPLVAGSGPTHGGPLRASRISGYFAWPAMPSGTVRSSVANVGAVIVPARRWPAVHGVRSEGWPRSWEEWGQVLAHVAYGEKAPEHGGQQAPPKDKKGGLVVSPRQHLQEQLPFACRHGPCSPRPHSRPFCSVWDSTWSGLCSLQGPLCEFCSWLLGLPASPLAIPTDLPQGDPRHDDCNIMGYLPSRPGNILFAALYYIVGIWFTVSASTDVRTGLA